MAERSQHQNCDGMVGNQLYSHLYRLLLSVMPFLGLDSFLLVTLVILNLALTSRLLGLPFGFLISAFFLITGSGSDEISVLMIILHPVPPTIVSFNALE